MEQNLIELIVQIELPEADADELDSMSRSLRAELLDLDVASVEPVGAGSVPQGARAVDWNLLGEWTVRLGVASVPGLFDLLKQRLQRAPAATPLKIRVKVGRRREAEIEYDPSHTTPQELADLVKGLQQALTAK